MVASRIQTRYNADYREENRTWRLAYRMDAIDIPMTDKRVNPATAVDTEEYETYAKHADVNEYDATPWDKTDVGEDDDRLY